MIEIGKPIKEIKNREGIEEIEKGKYRILRRGFDWNQVFSDKYCVISQNDLEERLSKFIQDNGINAEIKKIFLGRFKWLIRFKTDIKVDNFIVVFRIENSTDKSRAFGFNTYLYDFVNKYTIPIIATETLACLSFRKKHIGRIEIDELLKNLKITIDFIRENINRLREYVEILRNARVNYYQFKELLEQKDDKGRSLYAKQLREVILAPLRYLYYRDFKKDYSKEVSVLTILQVIQKNLLWKTPSVANRVITTLPRILNDLVFKSFYGGFKDE